ncbi:MAG: pyridoxal-dependent decarboxylase, exosortase A system-associated [Chakrabartia godavariana]
MKPMGPIPPGYVGRDNELLIGGQKVSDIFTSDIQTPLFVYDFQLIRERIFLLREALPPSLGLHYAIKANPLPQLVKLLAPLVDGLDVASGGELQVAREAGARHISFAGPGKTDAELEAAIRAGIELNLESEGELRRALHLAERLSTTPKLAVRVNPDFDLKGSGMRMGGGAKPFGVDAERVPAMVRTILAAGADWRGFHIFAGSQALDAGAISETQAQTIALATRLAEAVGEAPPFVNLGGGFGVPYFPNDVALDVRKVGETLGKNLDQRSDILEQTTFAIELGRYLVAEAGVYLTRVVDRKISHGEIFLVTDGGMHHQLAASGNFGTVVRRNYPIAVASRFETPATEVATVVGCLCTPLDRLGDQVLLPGAEEGDVIAVFMAGAYGATASPAAFLGHPPAGEIIVGVAP